VTIQSCFAPYLCRTFSHAGTNLALPRLA
jgi:hypothetical protein